MTLLIMIKMFDQAFKINNKYNNYIVCTYVQNYYTFYVYKCTVLLCVIPSSFRAKDGSYIQCIECKLQIIIYNNIIIYAHMCMYIGIDIE